MMLTTKQIQLLLTVLFAFVYLVAPIDLLPDVFPIFGLLDDLALIAYVFFRMKHYLDTLEPMPETVAPSRSEFRDHIRAFSGPEPHRARVVPRRFAASKNPYEVLGIDPRAGNRQIKDAYRGLVRHYHPDRVSHLGKSMQASAHERMIEIQQAYEQLRKSA